jgi:hypothetical protein
LEGYRPDGAARRLPEKKEDTDAALSAAHDAAVFGAPVFFLFARYSPSVFGGISHTAMSPLSFAAEMKGA